MIKYLVFSLMILISLNYEYLNLSIEHNTNIWKMLRCHNSIYMKKIYKNEKEKRFKWLNKVINE